VARLRPHRPAAASSRPRWIPRLPTGRAQSAASRRQMLTDSAHEESASAAMVRVCRFPFEMKGT
jgi:hypothetical protein